ncbi:hypothetical protein MJO28_006782 [Puccinia striiformis f. sp. tritici]|uniref:Uncharacterized protein n=1 Tax=Puccinia striiformis f. sp. tritici TaxID=168172 RepID=A0ACC0EIF3_9BASI|nr:hypothetical protein MJO28_006782 [Puccinia striiformis f. sp. tritici]
MGDKLLHCFSLPNEIINSIEISKNSNNQNYGDYSEGKEKEKEEEEVENQKTRTNDLLNYTCTTCNINFESNETQRNHFRSDWHRFNIKLTTSSNKPVDQAKFNTILEELQDSLSGSDSESNDDDDDDDDDEDNPKTKNMQDKFNQLTTSSADQIDDHFSDIALLSPSSPLIWFTVSASSSTSNLEDESVLQLGFYRSIFANTFPSNKLLIHNQEELNGLYKNELLALQRPFLSPSTSFPSQQQRAIQEEDEEEGSFQEGLNTWTIIMMGGGHFAAMIVSTIPKLKNKNKSIIEVEPIILQHKTFHRYTTRRKQGGGQASHDGGGKGAAKSAGASLRRYNEQTLVQEIQDLLKTWQQPIRDSQLIFIRASKSNMKTFFKDDPKADSSHKFDRGDPRIRSLPFVTKRPTFNELKRCFNELTRVKVIKTTRSEMASKEALIREEYENEKRRREEQIQRKKEQIEKIKIEEDRKLKEREELKREKTEAEKLEEIEDNRWERVIEMVRKGKLEPLKEFIKKYDQTNWFGLIPTRLIERTSETTNGCISLLHLASLFDQPEIVEYMLNETESDPTLTIPKSSSSSLNKAHLTAYELSISKNTRNVFRIAMATYPDKFDWLSKAKVPSPLTLENHQLQINKSKDWNKKIKDKLKERDKIKSENEKLILQNQVDSKKEELSKKQEKKATVIKHVNRLGGNGSGGSSSTPSRKLNHAANDTNLSEQQKLRLERERRARAAEARLQ